MRLLSICPSRNRPEMLGEMLDSYYATKALDGKMLVYIADDDPRLDDYMKIYAHYKELQMVVGRPRGLAKVYNYVTSELYPDIDYYQEINDDHIYRTKGWDKAFIDKIENAGKGWGIAFGEDLLGVDFSIWRHPTALVISGNIVRTLGYMVWPELDYRRVDTYYRDIAEGIGAFYRMLEIVIEHRHWINGRRGQDSNFDAVNSHELCMKGDRDYQNWVDNYRSKDIAKIKKARGF